MKPGKTFNLKKTTKTMLASIADPQKRSEWKRAMIDAQLCSEVVIKTPSRDKNAPRGNGPTGYQTNDTGTASTSTS
jgi:hypothetical protein